MGGLERYKASLLTLIRPIPPGGGWSYFGTYSRKPSQPIHILEALDELYSLIKLDFKNNELKAFYSINKNLKNSHFSGFFGPRRPKS